MTNQQQTQGGSTTVDVSITVRDQVNRRDGSKVRLAVTRTTVTLINVGTRGGEAKALELSRDEWRALVACSGRLEETLQNVDEAARKVAKP